MLRPFLFELFRIITIQYSLYILCKCQKKKKKGNQEKHEHCATKEQIPSFKIAFQKSDECCGAPELGILLNNCQGTPSVRKW